MNAFALLPKQSGDLFAGNMVGFRWMKRVPKWSKPIIMAAITGLIGIGFPQVGGGIMPWCPSPDPASERLFLMWNKGFV